MLNIHALPAIKDNYIWVIQRSDKKGIYIVDPGEARPVQNYTARYSLPILGILVTHQHWDHVTGIAELVEEHHCEVFGPAIERVPQVTQPLREGDVITLWDDMVLSVMETPGHLPDHISYYFEFDGTPHLFCADTLFSAGCGRIFRGTFEEFKHSLDRIKALPAETVLFPTHEYTLQNLNFAAAADPENTRITEEIQRVKEIRANGEPSLPTSVERERAINPFLRCDQPGLQRTFLARTGRKATNEVEVFKELREWKNVF